MELLKNIASKKGLENYKFLAWKVWKVMEFLQYITVETLGLNYLYRLDSKFISSIVYKSHSLLRVTYALSMFSLDDLLIRG